MRYILNALQKLSALDLVPLKVGGCFPLRLVLSSTGVVIIAWAVTGGTDVDMKVVCTWICEGIDLVMTGGLGCMGDDRDMGVVVIPWSAL